VIDRKPPVFEIAPLRPDHLRDAAGLFASAYRAARRRQPLLPAGHEDPAQVLLKLERLARGRPGVAAVRGGRLVGYLLGQVLPAFRGRRSAYVPEWAHAARGPGRLDVYRAMYARLSEHWVAEGCLSHLITVLANDRAVTEGWFWLGFGMIAVDAVRDSRPPPPAGAEIDIRLASPADAGRIAKFATAIRRHMEAAPVFVPFAGAVSEQDVRGWLADPGQAVFIACRDGKPAGCIHIQPANPSAAWAIQDTGTASIKGAFTRPQCRGVGVATTLLARAVRWADDNGYRRCAVDFEPQNLPAARFWLRHFQPVCYSVQRHLNPPSKESSVEPGNHA